MLSALFKNYIYPIATISGAIIGVGFFALPYIAMKAGLGLMLFYLFFLTFLITVLHLIFGEISLKTPDFKRLPGFVEYHLGKWPGKLSLLVSSIGLFALLLVYLVVGSNFLTNILSFRFGGTQFHYALIFFITAALVILLGIKLISKVELAVICFLLLSLAFVFLKGIPEMSLQNISFWPKELSIKNLFLPYGAIVFALWGAGIIPETEELLGKSKKVIKKVIIVATLLPAVIYLFFILGVLSISGSATTESAFSGLAMFLGPRVVTIGFLVGIVTTFVGFIISGLTLKKVLVYDLKIKNSLAFIIVCSVPLILFLLGFNSFIHLVSFIGGFILGINGIFILLMYKKIGGKNIVIYPLFLIFALGIVYQIWYFK